MLGIEDREVALDFDLAMAAIHRVERGSRIRSAVEQSKGMAEAGILHALLEP